MAHRGPDDQGVRVGEGWGLASRRLAIIGLTTGHMPMTNEDKTMWVVFNGEIYNHRALRSTLTAQGHVFRTGADTEVLLHLYEQCGPDMLGQLDGMFAFAIVDTRSRSLFLARDRFGQKPLLYHETPDGHLAFASDLPALLKFPGIARRINRQAIYDYLSLSYIPAPDTVYEGVRKLPPASCLAARYGHPLPSPQEYWRLPYEPKHALHFDHAVDQGRELLERAVAARLESEVPLGAFLSGGLDSTIVTALMKRHMTKPLHTFTIGFEEARYDERRFAQVAAEHIGTTHHVSVAQPQDLDLLRYLAPHYGEPFADSSMLPTALLSAFTREHVTVALSGDAGDELFGGYQRYQVMALHKAVSNLPEKLRDMLLKSALAMTPRPTSHRTVWMTVRRLLTALDRTALPAYASFQEAFSETEKRDFAGWIGSDYREGWRRRLDRASAEDPVERYLELDTGTYLPGDLLVKVDRASMSHSLEVRSPFLCHHLVEFTAKLPRSYKVGLTARKRLLAAIAAPLAPNVLRQRSKRGFGVPIGDWLRREWQDVTRALAAEHGSWDTEGLLRGTVLSQLAHEHLAGTHDHAFKLWTVLCLRMWYETVHHA